METMEDLEKAEWEKTVTNHGRNIICAVDHEGMKHHSGPGEKFTGRITTIIHGGRSAHYTVE